MTDDFLAAFEARRAARLQADRSLTIAGETLTFRPTVAPEVGMRLEQMRQTVRAQLETIRAKAADAEKAAESNGGEADMTALSEALENLSVTDEDMLQIGDETVIACLEPDSHPGWARLRSPEASQPVTFDEVFEVADYLLGRVAGIPTSAPADSSDGRTQTDKPSKARSSSPAKIPVASA